MTEVNVPGIVLVMCIAAVIVVVSAYALLHRIKEACEGSDDSYTSLEESK